MKKCLVLLVTSLLVLGGCSVITTDFRRAAEIATKYGDTNGATCYNKAAELIDKQSALLNESGSGLVSEIEKVRILRLGLESNRADIEKSCGPLVVDVMLQGLNGIPGVK